MSQSAPKVPTAVENEAFTELVKQALYGISLNIKEKVVATQRELAVLRRCSELVRSHPERVVHIVATAQNNRRSRFVENTLLHLGVSCGQIKLDTAGRRDTPDSVWLLIANR